MSQLVQITVTNRGANLDLLPGGPTLYGFDVDDIVSPIRYSSGLSKSYFTTRTNKGGVNNNHNGSKIDYRSSDLLSAIAIQSPKFVLLTVLTRRGVDMSSEQMVFVSSKISEDLVPDATSGGTKFFYIEDGDPLPVEYIVQETIPEIIAQTVVGQFIIQDRGSAMPNEPALNFVGFTVEDQAGVSTDIINVKDIDYLDLVALRDNSLLPVGAMYRIQDRFNYQKNGTAGVPNLTYKGDDRGYVYIQAIDVNKLSKNVIRVMACPADYTYTSQKTKVWHSTKTFAIADEAIWGGKIWDNLTGAVGAPLAGINRHTALDGTNWSERPKSGGSGYVDVEFKALYDIDNDWFEKQWDSNGNEFGFSFSYKQFLFSSYNFNLVDICDWNTSIISGILSLEMSKNKCIGVWNNVSGIIYSNNNDGVIIENNTYTPIIENRNSGNILSNTTDGGINNNSRKTGNITGISGQEYMSYDLLFSGAGSDFYELDITGLTTIDLISATSKYKGVILLKSSNATETINLFSNWTDNKSIVFNIESGLIVTFTHGTGAGQPRCEGAVSAVVDGTTSDWIEFEFRPGNIVRQKNIGTY